MRRILLSRKNFDVRGIQKVDKEEYISNYEFLKNTLINTYYGVENFFYIKITITSDIATIFETREEHDNVEIINTKYLKELEFNEIRSTFRNVHFYNKSSLNNAYELITLICRNYGGRIENIEIYELEEMNKKELTNQISRLKEKLRKEF